MEPFRSILVDVDATDRAQPALERATRLARSSGEPEDVIPEFVVAEGIELVMMGSVARRGIPGFLIGNTAERVLPRLPCSFLVVKPGESAAPGRSNPA